MKHRISALFSVTVLSLAILSACSSDNDSTTETPTTTEPVDKVLQFDASDTKKVVSDTLTVTLDGVEKTITRYTVTYVAYPTEMVDKDTLEALEDPHAYQKMYIYVPDGQESNTDTAIIMQVRNWGWYESALGGLVTFEDGGEYVSDSDTDRAGTVLRDGYIAVDVATRGRGNVDANGNYAGKGAKVIVDTKAAIRYLRLNDEVLPGDSEKIVITGLSGGGALSSAVAAMGNSPDFYSGLYESGAAGMTDESSSTIGDDVYAVITYCPITDLAHSDIAYEWQYHDTRLLDEEFATSDDYANSRSASTTMSESYAAYLSSLGLKLDDGTTQLTVDTMPDAIVVEVKNAIIKAIDKNNDSDPDNNLLIPAIGEEWSVENRDGSVSYFANTWLTVTGTELADITIDYDAYLASVAEISNLKGTPAFDPIGVFGNIRGGESSLYGPQSLAYMNFTEFSWNNNDTLNDSSGIDDTGVTWEEYLASDDSKLLRDQIKMTSPIPYLIDYNSADNAPNWYVRHGIRDRDTSFAIEMQLFYAVKNSADVMNANVGLAYFQGHAGNYDVQEAYAWLTGLLDAE